MEELVADTLFYSPNMLSSCVGLSYSIEPGLELPYPADMKVGRGPLVLMQAWLRYAVKQHVVKHCPCCFCSTVEVELMSNSN